MSSHIGILHPGEMGISVAASAKSSGHEVYWVSEGSGAKTRERAERYGLIEIASLDPLCKTCAIIISVCPPHAAEEVADQVLASNFKGVYVDANAISPQRTKHIAQNMESAGINFVDGGIIGGPAWKPNSTWLYLSGKESKQIATCFAAGPLETEVISDEAGKASALKMCYAAYSKGTTALLCATVAAAESLGVRDELMAQWKQDGEKFDEQATQRIRRVTAKAWRFAGEMEEIAATFDEVGLPNGFHVAATEVYQRMANFKDAEKMPELEEVVKKLKER